MDYYYELNDSFKTIKVKTSGDLTKNEFAKIDRLMRIKAKELNYNLLFDFRHSKNRISITDAYYWFTDHYKNDQELSYIPTVKLSSHEDELFFGFFETTCTNKGIPIKMFLDEEPAMVWLEKH